MSENNRSFVSAFLIQGAPVILSAAAAFFAGQANTSSSVAVLKTDRALENTKITQARIEERDRISADGGYMIPVSQDLLWANYFACRNIDKKDRKFCAGEAKNADAVETPKLVSLALN